MLLYLDEIQYFNKKQQQSLLEFMENGKITLIASTTENPYFYVYNAVLSRSTVFEFKPIDRRRTSCPPWTGAVHLMEERAGGADPVLEEGVRGAHRRRLRRGRAQGHERRGAAVPPRGEQGAENFLVTLADAQTVAQRSAMRYDREGDDHYDIALRPA